MEIRCLRATPSYFHGSIFNPVPCHAFTTLLQLNFSCTKRQQCLSTSLFLHLIFGPIKVGLVEGMLDDFVTSRMSESVPASDCRRIREGEQVQVWADGEREGEWSSSAFILVVHPARSSGHINLEQVATGREEGMGMGIYDVCILILTKCPKLPRFTEATWGIYFGTSPYHPYSLLFLSKSSSGLFTIPNAKGVDILRGGPPERQAI